MYYKTMKAFEKLGLEYLKYSEEIYGWQTIHFDNNAEQKFNYFDGVRLYFEIGGEHTCASFSHNGVKVSIDYHTNPTITCEIVKDKLMKENLLFFADLLEKIKANTKDNEKEIKKAEKEKLKQALLEELAKLD